MMFGIITMDDVKAAYRTLTTPPKPVTVELEIEYDDRAIQYGLVGIHNALRLLVMREFSEEIGHA